MIGVLILTHGRLADELLAAARTISGELTGFAAVSLDWNEGFEQAQERIRQTLAELDTGDGVLVLTDMFGGTPCNVALTFLEPGRIEIVTGVNLPMVVRLGCLVEKGMKAGEAAKWLQAKGQRSVCVASEMIAARRGEPAASEPGPCGEAVAAEPVATAADDPKGLE